MLVTKQTGPKGKQVNRLYIEEGSTIDRELYLAALVDRATSRMSFVVSTEGGMDIEEVAHKTPGQDHHHRRRSGDRHLPAPRAPHRAGAAPHRRSAEADERRCSGALQGLHREGHEPARDQSADRHQGRQAHLPRRQDQLRRQRAVPPSRHHGAARPHRGGRQGDRGVEIRPQLRRARRHHRLHGQRRRSGDGDDGHHQALRRGARELPRRRRRRDHREGGGGVQDHHLRSEGEGHPGQHLRRHHEVRHHRGRRGRGGARRRPQRAAGGAARRHQRRAGQEDHRQVESQRTSAPTTSTTPRRRSSRP